MDNNYFTPFGARVEPPPTIKLPPSPRVPYEWMIAICIASWAMAILVTFNLGIQTYYGLANLDRQLAWDARR